MHRFAFANPVFWALMFGTSAGMWAGEPLPEAGFQLPAFGNSIAHERLFGNPPTTVSKSPPRLWRIRPRAYQELLGEVSPNRSIPVTEPFSLDSQGSGFRDFAALHHVDGPSFQILLSNASAVAAQMTSAKFERGRFVRANWETPDELLTILDPANKEPTDAQFELAIRRHFHRVLQRDPTDEERQRLLAFTRRGIDRVGRLRAVQSMLAAVLLKPEALFRIEMGHGQPDQHGRVMLSPRELAYAVSYGLTDHRPDAALLQDATQGTLASREAVGRHVERILEDPGIPKPRILQFFREYFEYGTAIDVFKDQLLFVHHDAQVLVNDTDQLILSILATDREVLRELLTTNRSYINFYFSSSREPVRNTQRYAHLSYNLPHEWQWTPRQPIELPKHQRAGILTQPSWLIAHSDNFNNHAIRRGKWIRERLLGGTVPDLPITVDARLPDDDALTLREKMEVTRQEYCWSCHQEMDPLGLPFERYDHFGRWRSHELKRTVVTTGGIDRSGEASLDGVVEDPIAMIKRLADSPRVRQVFVRHAFRFWMGRNETPDDAATLQRADRDYVDSSGSMKALIRSLLTSDSFLYREVLGRRACQEKGR